MPTPLSGSSTDESLEPSVSKIDWPVLLFATASPLVAIAGTAWWIAAGQFHWQTIVLGVVLGMATGLGITGGYHRLYSHRSFDAVWPTRLFLLLLGGAAIEESALKWCWDHRRHHRKVDREDDPYGIQRGFWHAHFLWMFRKRGLCDEERWPSDLWSDPLVRFQHKYYLWLAIPVSFGVPFGLACLWGDPWGGLLVAGMARVVVNHHLTFAINSVCHSIGSQPYSDRHSARDNWATAFFTYGEGFHNFHHEFASDYRNGHKPYHYDPTKWMIYLLGQMRLARNLRTSRSEVITTRRIAMQEKRVGESLRARSRAGRDAAAARLAAARARVDAAFEALQHVRQSYRASRDEAPRPTRETASRLSKARHDFEQAVAMWEATVERI